jgi:MFS transporter, ceroid-lipofuscinosis neuronal protein 7
MIISIDQTMFDEYEPLFFSFSFSFVQIDTSAEATFLGWLVASFSIGQLIASPLIGYIANRTDKNKSLLVVSTALIVASNILYAYVQTFNNFLLSNKWWIMLARFIMGMGAGTSQLLNRDA